MSKWLDGLIGGVTGFFTGGPVGAVAGAYSGYSAGKKNEEQQKLQQQTNAQSIELSNTANQRRVADLKAAGLNPMLAYSQGGAPVPSLGTPQVSDVGEQSFKGVSAGATVRNVESSTKVNEAQAVKSAAEARLTIANARQAEIEADKQEFLRSQGSFAVFGKELDAKEAKAILEQFKASNDWNTVKFLNEFAVKKGYRNFDQAVQSQSFRRDLQEYSYRQLQFPEAEAVSDFYKTSWGHEIAPYLSSGQSALGLGHGALSFGRRLLQK